MVGNGVLDRKNPIYRDLAGYFFELGLASLTFRKHLSQEELRRFCELIGRKRSQGRESEDLATTLHAAGVLHIQARMISYEAFSATEEELVTAGNAQTESSLWERFVFFLMLDMLDPSGRTETPPDTTDPVKLAVFFNRQGAGTSSTTGGAECTAGITTILRVVERSISDFPPDQSIDQWQLFLGRLAPELRASLVKGGERDGAGQVILPPVGSVSDEYRSADEGVGRSFLRSILGAMPLDGESEQHPIQIRREGDPVEKQLRLVFREDTSDLPLCNEGIGFPALITPLPQISVVETATLTGELEPILLETQEAAVLLRLLSDAVDGYQCELLERRITALCASLLERGNFSLLTEMHRDLAARDATAAGNGILGFFGRPTFFEEVLNCLCMEGKERHGDIGALIQEVGASFATPLLNRLASEPAATLRRFYMQQLRGIGADCFQLVQERLKDERWFFVRNLIILLRMYNDRTILENIRPLVTHTHRRVRQEALKTLISFRDPDGDRILLAGLSSDRKSRRLEAVEFSDSSSNQEVFARLCALLASRALTVTGFKLQESVVETLARMGRPEALPTLERLLRSRNFLRPLLLNRLKRKVLLSLKRYPAGSLSEYLRESSAGISPPVREKRR
jgi:hypothetical protein